MSPFNIIVAVDSKNGIGKNGQLPWRLPGELKHFKEVTCSVRDGAKQNAVIMGRKTWESLPEKFRPLPQRLNVVLTRQEKLSLPPEILRSASLQVAMEVLQQAPWAAKIESVFVIGGGDVFAQALSYPSCHKIFLTVIDHDFQCDVFLPAIPPRFKKVAETGSFAESGLSYRFFEFAI